jgi:hypothetical protein
VRRWLADALADRPTRIRSRTERPLLLLGKQERGAGQTRVLPIVPCESAGLVATASAPAGMGALSLAVPERRAG